MLDQSGHQTNYLRGNGFCAAFGRGCPPRNREDINGIRQPPEGMARTSPHEPTRSRDGGGHFRAPSIVSGDGPLQAVRGNDPAARLGSRRPRARTGHAFHRGGLPAARCGAAGNGPRCNASGRRPCHPADARPARSLSGPRFRPPVYGAADQSGFPGARRRHGRSVQAGGRTSSTAFSVQRASAASWSIGKPPQPISFSGFAWRRGCRGRAAPCSAG